MPGMRESSAAFLFALLGTSACTAQTSTPLPVHVGGRTIANDDGSLTFGWPAVYFESRFHGTAVSVSIETRDDRLQLLIDGAQKALLIQPGSTSLTIAGLTPSDHVVRLEKVTESQAGGSRFMAVAISNAIITRKVTRSFRRGKHIVCRHNKIYEAKLNFLHLMTVVF